MRNLFDAAVAIELINAGVLAEDVRKTIAKVQPSDAFLSLIRRAGRPDQSPFTSALVITAGIPDADAGAAVSRQA